VYCDNCHLCQLSYVVPPEQMFKHYLFVTSTTETARTHFKNMATRLVTEFNLDKKSLAVDIGSNDGLLLKYFQEKGVRVVGVESADNICEIARKDGIDTLNGFFNKKIVTDILKMKGKADVITANNVFAHISDIKDITDNVKTLLNDQGAFVIEVQYLVDTIKELSFDNIYHEHLSYFSVTALNNFFKKQDMQVFKVEHVDVHGGSIRVYAQKAEGKQPIDDSVNKFIRDEKEFGLDKYETYQKFSEEVLAVKDKTKTLLENTKKENKKIIGYGAPAKATTLLNFYQVDNNVIDYIVDDNPLKQGKIIPGVRIPIKTKEHMDGDKADYILIFAWNFADEIMKKNKEYAEKNNAKFIILTKELKIV